LKPIIILETNKILRFTVSNSFIMKYLSIYFFTLFIISSCTYNRVTTPQSRIESPEELKARLLLESKLQNPELKGYMLGVKRPYIYSSYKYTDSPTTVAGLSGKIELLFNRDSLIKVITFTHEHMLTEKALEFSEFANLIKEKYNLGWVIDNEDNLSNNQKDFISEKENIIFSLSQKNEEVYTASDLESFQHKQQLKKLRKEKSENGLYEWEIAEIEKLQREIHYKEYDWKISYIFKIIDKDFAEQVILEQRMKQYSRERQEIESELQKTQEEKEKLLKDF